MKEILGLVTFLAYISLTLLAPAHMVAMANMKMPMEHCPLSFSLHNFCNMSLIEHVNSWNSFLKTTFQKNFYSLPYLPLLLGSFITFNSINLQTFFKRQRLRKLFYKLENMYSTGILNPKVY